MARRIILGAALAAGAAANDNGLAKTPPMGWRSWNLYGANVNQKLIEGIMEGMVKKDRTVDGKPTSLCDLGYCDVGLDDNWQKCGKYGTEGLTYHQDDGSPVVNHDRFPNFKDMTDKAHSLGLKSGWYGNNCICSDQKTSDKKFYAGDVKAMRAFGFDSWKLDGCGAQTDLQLWDDLIKATPPTSGRDPIMVENCHWGSKVPFEPNATWCPWNFYRTSGDVRAKYASVVGNLQVRDRVLLMISARFTYDGGHFSAADHHQVRGAEPLQARVLGLPRHVLSAGTLECLRRAPGLGGSARLAELDRHLSAGSRWAASTGRAAPATPASPQVRRDLGEVYLVSRRGLLMTAGTFLQWRLAPTSPRGSSSRARSRCRTT